MFLQGLDSAIWKIKHGTSSLIECLLSSFFIDEMKTFAGQQIEPLFQFSWLIVFLTLMLCGGLGLLLAFTVDAKLGIAVALSVLALLYVFFSKYVFKFDWSKILE